MEARDGTGGEGVAGARTRAGMGVGLEGELTARKGSKGKITAEAFRMRGLGRGGRVGSSARINLTAS